MDKTIDARFDRVEKTLATLIDSIAKYNPSTALADDLLTADKALSNGLQELQTHQNNHLRILALRSEVAALDTQIKTTLLSLATSRKEILAAPATTYPEDDINRRRAKKTKNNEFTYEQLMSYARRISRNTVAAPGQTDGAEFFGVVGVGNADGSRPGTAPATAAATPAATPAATNGVGTPAAADTPGGAGIGAAGPGGATAANTTAATSAVATQTATPVAFSSVAPSANVPDVLPLDYQQYVAPQTGTVFFPWPMPDLMQNAALRMLQTATETKEDGSGQAKKIRFVSLEEQEERERERAAREAREREEWEERQRKMAAEAAEVTVGAGGAHGHAGGSSRPAAPAQFSLTLDLDDDE